MCTHSVQHYTLDTRSVTTTVKNKSHSFLKAIQSIPVTTFINTTPLPYVKLMAAYTVLYTTVQPHSTQHNPAPLTPHFRSYILQSIPPYLTYKPTIHAQIFLKQYLCMNGSSWDLPSNPIFTTV
jgi:hypothetical protein